MTKAQSHYKSLYHPQEKLSRANVKLYRFIIDLDVSSIFEFGCGVGRNLLALKSLGYITRGCDINAKAVYKAKARGLDVFVSNEHDLLAVHRNSFDLVITNSVLCHIQRPSMAYKRLKRISNKYVLCFECSNEVNKFWWAHDYEKQGFKQVMEHTTEKGRIYKLWLWEKR